MIKFLKRLQIRASGNKIPVYDELKVEGWKLSADVIHHEFDEEYFIDLNYRAKLNVTNRELHPENLIRERFLKEIEWQIYGDTQRLLVYLKRHLTQPQIDPSECLEIVGEIEREISGGLER